MFIHSFFNIIIMLFYYNNIISLDSDTLNDDKKIK